MQDNDGVCVCWWQESQCQWHYQQTTDSRPQQRRYQMVYVTWRHCCHFTSHVTRMVVRTGTGLQPFCFIITGVIITDVSLSHTCVIITDLCHYHRCQDHRPVSLSQTCVVRSILRRSSGTFKLFLPGSLCYYHLSRSGFRHSTYQGNVATKVPVNTCRSWGGSRCPCATDWKSYQTI